MIYKYLGFFKINLFGFQIRKSYGNRLVKIIIRLFKKLGPQSEELLVILSALCENHNLLKKEEKFIYLIYIVCLIESKNYETATNEIIYYAQEYNKQDFNSFLPIINFIKETKIFEKNSAIFDFFNKQEFSEFIKGKSIAVVGNGPQELGTNHGCEIDSHDIVIRFNFFENNKYKQDYGTKTDLWIINFEAMNRIKPSMRASNVMFKLTEKTGFFDYRILQKWQKYYKKSFYMDYVDIKVAQETLKKRYSPTLGFCIAIKLFKEIGSLKNVDFYGFSFLEDTYKPLKHYYDNLSEERISQIQKVHCHEEESLYLKKLVQGKDFIS